MTIKIEEMKKAISDIRPAVTPEQAKEIESMASDLEKEGAAGDPIEGAIKKWKKANTVRKGSWVDRKSAKAATESRSNEISEYEDYAPVRGTMGARTFDELDAMRQAENATEEIGQLTSDFTNMLRNIVWSMSENKIADMRTLFDGYASRAEAILSDGGSSGDMGEVDMQESYASDPADIVFLEDNTGKSNSLIRLNVKVIRPGWGNKRDNNFYPAEMLKQNAIRFIGAKMYETDHRDDQKTTRTWVSTVEKISGFDADGAPIAQVAVHDPNFAERIKNLHEANMLEKMECSIMGSASGMKFEKDGRRGRLIEGINSIESVDWVTRAGAGGHAVNLIENEGEHKMEQDDKKPDTMDTSAEEPTALPNLEEASIQEQDQEKPELEELQLLTEAKVLEVLSESKLPKRSQERIAMAEYGSEEDLSKAISAELDYIADLTKSGEVFGMAESKSKPKKLSISE